MPKAELGSTKQLNNKLKSKGLQRLRWYCQVCEKQCRDENGFKMHAQSESHTRKMLLVGEDPKKFIEGYSNQFKRDFLLLLRTAHGEKSVQLNHFYQEYIGNKEHVHMNATRWPSLTEFAKFLGREGICRVEENEKGIHVAWIDNSPENLRRQDAVRKKERQDRGDEERELRLIGEQIRRAQRDAEGRAGAGLDGEGEGEEGGELKREEGEKIKLSFGAKATPTAPKGEAAGVGADAVVAAEDAIKIDEVSATEPSTEATPSTTPAEPAKVTMKMGFSSKPKNVFAAKKNALGGKKKPSTIEQPKVMSEAERIMKEEIERNSRKRASGPPTGFGGGPSQKKQRF